MAVMDAVDTEASLTKFKSLVREKEKKAKRRSISVRWGRYASAAAAFLAGLVFAVQSPNQKIPDRKTKCVIKTHINIKQNVIFSAKLKPV